ncbi:class I SAM-dependent methyltransferase [Planococcus salinarum]|uniref:class I SAM-dependent methyltransferase n=1 Tax=Planococcus salinarum TaxID=622695 RepID=UPI000E3CC9F1|nr:class I SAM-dependent methyltransferase [Planococcus salinarum]TAA72491.1 class I SAM-dependent methyltransferase [Planococcus salinarum]
MDYKGSSVYEERDFLENFLKRRSRKDSPNNAIEGPAIDLLLASVEGADILDLGCGDGTYGNELLARGAGSYTGVEGAAAMVELAASRLLSPKGAVIHSSLENFEYPANRYDVVLSRMVIHYIDNIEKLFASISQTMKKEGKFVFSVQHPLITASFASKIDGDKRGNWLVDDYFIQGERQEPWIGKTVVKYHRSIETYFGALSSAGFMVEALQEGQPKPENFADSGEFERRTRIPVVLIFSCRIAEDGQ